MKLTNIQDKLRDSIFDSIRSICYNEIYCLTLVDIRRKIEGEIRMPNSESISGIQIGIINDLENEIN